MVDRLKKIRGFKSPHAKKSFVKLSDIVRVFTSEETVSAETLVGKETGATGNYEKWREDYRAWNRAEEPFF